MGQFDKQISSASRLIARYGQLVKWRVVRNDTPVDYLQPWKRQEPTSFVEHDVSICFFSEGDSLKYFKDSEVQTGSIVGYMGAVNFEPSLKDVVIRNNKELRIRSIDALAPNGQNILYTIAFLV